MIRKIKQSDVIDVSKIHYRNLNDTISSQMGIEFLRYLYGALLNDEDSYAYVYSKDNKAVAVISHSLNYAKTSSKVTSNITPKIILIVIAKLIKRPALIIELFQNIILNKKIFAILDDKSLYLSTLVVEKSSQRSGIGRSLLAKVIELAKLKGKNRVVLSLKKSNKKALNFYRKSGFKKLIEYNHYIVMEK